jgi:hypothetical protein
MTVMQARKQREGSLVLITVERGRVRKEALNSRNVDNDNVALWVGK